ncbi:alkaline phosphatase family protein [Diaporthe helianthi]|uniref:Alkaline phosphatase family protein n=1 Tax=Diaporthe helianthi TaxID=158607 RepID=A0A2P5IDC9_DIAHE|nr:alkaline phosphatase family protein [Diaporthe helianthi]
MAIEYALTVASTIVLRAVSYFFLRWGLLPPLAPIAFTAFAVYVPSCITSFFSTLQGGPEGVVRTETTRIRKFTKVDGKVIEDVDVTDSRLSVDGPQNIWHTILAGVPNPRNLVLTLLTFMVNLACVTMVADRLYSEHMLPTEGLSFVRPGFISNKEAKILVREPNQSKLPVRFEIRVKEDESPFAKAGDYVVAGTVKTTSDDTDYTAVIAVALNHNSQRTYEWRTSNGHQGEFKSAPEPGKYPDNGKFTFLSTSCIVNRLPYNPMDHPLSIPGMRYLRDVLPNLGAQFMLFLGDFIYADVPREWGENAAEFRQKYRAVYASPEWPSVGQNLSWIHVLDDHEIHNDWDGNTTGIYAAAVEPWHHYHTAVNPPAARKPAGWTISRTGPTWFEFAQGPANFFMADTRSYRSSNKIDYEDKDKTMLGTAQLVDLLAFLRRSEPRGVDWKIIAFSVPFTKNWPVNVQDTWGGFLAERKIILEAMWDAASRGIGVVVLSGDRHEFAATKFPPPQGSKWAEEATVYEFSASPLSQFYSPIGTYRQVDNEDVKIKYINKGYSKFGAITIEKGPEIGRSSLSYSLFVDGVEAWNTTVLSPEKIVQSTDGAGIWDRLTGRG